MPSLFDDDEFVVTVRQCSFCGVVKPISEYNADKQNKTGFRCYCRECHKAHHRVYDPEYRNREEVRYRRTAQGNKRRATKKMRSIPLTDVEKLEIEQIYLQSRIMTLQTGVKHCVDHILPIKHEYGLHHPLNLRVITESENNAKQAKITPEGLAVMPILKRIYEERVTVNNDTEA